MPSRPRLPTDQQRRRRRALARILLTDDTNFEIATAVGLTPTDVADLRHRLAHSK